MPQPLETVSETSVTVTITVSGLSFWLNRDPIVEQGGNNLYGFVANSPVIADDYLGMWSTIKCCAGQVYSTYDYCCCDQGTVVFDGGAGCKLREKKKTATGVKLCKKAVAFRHGWLEIGGWSVGFYPAGNVVRSHGSIQINDSYAGQGTCEDYELNPCEYDFEKFKQAIKNKASADKSLCPSPPVNGNPNCPYHYSLGGYTCYQYRGDLVDHGKTQAKGRCTMP